jgi:hypothetical protein
MKKIIFGIIIAAIAASPAMAAKKAKKVKAAPVMATTTENSNENSLRFARDSLPIFLPSWTMPAYMATQNQR